MSNTVVVPRVFGGTLIITIAPPTPVVSTLNVTATFRDGKVTATHRDGNVTAGGR